MELILLEYYEKEHTNRAFINHRLGRSELTLLSFMTTSLLLLPPCGMCGGCGVCACVAWGPTVSCGVLGISRGGEPTRSPPSGPRVYTISSSSSSSCVSSVSSESSLPERTIIIWCFIVNVIHDTVQNGKVAWNWTKDSRRNGVKMRSQCAKTFMNMFKMRRFTKNTGRCRKWLRSASDTGAALSDSYPLRARLYSILNVKSSREVLGLVYIQAKKIIEKCLEYHRIVNTFYAGR